MKRSCMITVDNGKPVPTSSAPILDIDRNVVAVKLNPIK